jgi:hypothetical protein
MVKEVKRLQGDKCEGTGTDELINYSESMYDCRYKIIYNVPDENNSSICYGNIIHEVNDEKEDIVSVQKQCNYSDQKKDEINNFCISKKWHSMCWGIQDGNRNSLDK